MQEDDSSFQGRRLFKGRDTSWGIFYPTDYLGADAVRLGGVEPEHLGTELRRDLGTPVLVAQRPGDLDLQPRSV
jgi:hypothetical protein